jgi:hypothetical protein
MDQFDHRRLEHAEQTLAKGKAALPSDVQNGIYWIKSGLRLRATTLLKNDSPDALSAINELVDTAARLSHENGLSIAPSEQNELIFLSLFAKNRDTAIRLATLNIESSDKYPFTLAVRSYLASALSLANDNSAIPKVTRTESKFLEDLISVADRTPTDLSGADEFWSSLRKKRFANTIFEHKNIFKAALKFLQGS